MNKPWFRTMKHGLGWYPTSWQGWLTIAVFVALVLWNFFRIDAGSHSASDTLRPWFIQTVAMGLILILVGFLMAEKPTGHHSN